MNRNHLLSIAILFLTAPTILTVQAFGGDQSKSIQKSELLHLQHKRTIFAAKYGLNHPLIKALDARIAEITNQATESMTLDESATDSVKPRLDSTANPELLALERRRDTAATKYGMNHPMVKALEARIAEIRNPPVSPIMPDVSEMDDATLRQTIKIVLERIHSLERRIETLESQRLNQELLNRQNEN